MGLRQRVASTRLAGLVAVSCTSGMRGMVLRHTPPNKGFCLCSLYDFLNRKILITYASVVAIYKNFSIVY